jgi:CBS domain containing-hemolysin-like protein
VATALGLVGVFLLIVANGYFVAAEFAFVAVRRSSLEEWRHAGSKRAERAITVLDRLSFMLSGAQLGITVTSLVVGFLAEPTLGEALQPMMEWIGVGESAQRGAAIVAALVIVTIAQMIIGELAPKNLAIARPDGVSLWLATSVLTYTRLAAPLIKLFDNSANRLLRVVGIEPIETLRGGVTPEELDYLLEESARLGHLTGQQAELLLRSLEFGDLDAGDAMRPRADATTVTADTTGTALRHVAAAAHSRLPVVAADGDEHEIVGVLELKDLLSVPIERRDTITVAELMREPLFVPEQLPLPDVLQRMRAHITEMAVVVDEYGGFAGIITDEDLAEELVGPIDDEHDAEPEPVIVAIADRHFRVPASLRLDEVEREIDVELPEGDYDTIAGLVLDRLEHFPEKGESIYVDGHRLTVTEMDGRRITEIEIGVAATEGVEGVGEAPGGPGDDAGEDRR